MVQYQIILIIINVGRKLAIFTVPDPRYTVYLWLSCNVFLEVHGFSFTKVIRIIVYIIYSICIEGGVSSSAIVILDESQGRNVPPTRKICKLTTFPK